MRAVWWHVLLGLALLAFGLVAADSSGLSTSTEDRSQQQTMTGVAGEVANGEKSRPKLYLKDYYWASKFKGATPKKQYFRPDLGHVSRKKKKKLKKLKKLVKRLHKLAKARSRVNEKLLLLAAMFKVNIHFKDGSRLFAFEETKDKWRRNHQLIKEHSKFPLAFQRYRSHVEEIVGHRLDGSEVMEFSIGGVVPDHCAAPRANLTRLTKSVRAMGRNLKRGAKWLGGKLRKGAKWVDRKVRPRAGRILRKGTHRAWNETKRLARKVAGAVKRGADSLYKKAQNRTGSRSRTSASYSSTRGSRFSGSSSNPSSHSQSASSHSQSASSASLSSHALSRSSLVEVEANETPRSISSSAAVSSSHSHSHSGSSVSLPPRSSTSASSRSHSSSSSSRSRSLQSKLKGQLRTLKNATRKAGKWLSRKSRKAARKTKKGLKRLGRLAKRAGKAALRAARAGLRAAKKAGLVAKRAASRIYLGNPCRRLALRRARNVACYIMSYLHHAGFPHVRLRIGLFRPAGRHSRARSHAGLRSNPKPKLARMKSNMVTIFKSANSELSRRLEIHNNWVSRTKAVAALDSDKEAKQWRRLFGGWRRKCKDPTRWQNLFFNPKWLRPKFAVRAPSLNLKQAKRRMKKLIKKIKHTAKVVARKLKKAGGYVKRHAPGVARRIKKGLKKAWRSLKSTARKMRNLGKRTIKGVSSRISASRARESRTRRLASGSSSSRSGSASSGSSSSLSRASSGSSSSLSGPAASGSSSTRSGSASGSSRS